MNTIDSAKDVKIEGFQQDCGDCPSPFLMGGSKMGLKA